MQLNDVFFRSPIVHLLPSEQYNIGGLSNWLSLSLSLKPLVDELVLPFFKWQAELIPCGRFYVLEFLQMHLDHALFSEPSTTWFLGDLSSQTWTSYAAQLNRRGFWTMEL